VPTADAESTLQEVPPKQSEWKRIIGVFMRRKIAVVGLVIIVLIALTAIFAPLLAPYDPYNTDVVTRLTPPGSEHWLGTDAVGRDTLSRIIYASRTSLLVGVGAVGISAVIGQTLGLIAGYYGGWVFNIIMRLIDTMMAIPQLVLALVISTVLGGGLKNVIIALAIGGIPVHCRMMCGQVLTVKENDYVLAGKTIGASDMRMMFQHIFPNAFPSLLVVMTIGLGATILAEAGLSFLGVGINPPECAWGSMISDGYRFLRSNPILSIVPGVALMLVVFGFNMMGDGLRDALDPRLRGTL
jgi:ABC-type dipeptide/oligopeptide/nickel transport system permease subunit